MHNPTRSSKSVTIGTKIEWFLQKLSLNHISRRIIFAEHPEMMGPPGKVVPDIFGNINIIFQNSGNININIPGETSIGNIKNSSQNEQVLDLANMEQKFYVQNKPLPNRKPAEEER